MTLDNPAAVEVAHMLSSFAANLTDAAYSIVLRHGIRGSWIDLELELWKVLALLVAQKERNTSRLRSTVEFLACREMFLSELTEAAYRTAIELYRRLEQFESERTAARSRQSVAWNNFGNLLRSSFPPRSPFTPSAAWCR